ncbi:hypothetical protein Ahy_A03g015219 [Arachis hypogaea]|uniref:Uncharacterized protein n=1 Tax=Arachis hypogaea TaxID=3818 RepID=A0A445DZW7_ARAHY|nr:hypothetical protein Ahy_A03g015219 [Arachis hypogaea]
MKVIFNVHARLMLQHVMEWYAEVRDESSSSRIVEKDDSESDSDYVVEIGSSNDDDSSDEYTLNLNAMQLDDPFNHGDEEDYNSHDGVKFQVQRFGGPHTCLAPTMSQDHAQLGSSLIFKVILPIIHTDLYVSIPVLQSAVQQSYHFKSLYRKIWMAK